jgi:hypothetical protein
MILRAKNWLLTAVSRNKQRGIECPAVPNFVPTKSQKGELR